MKNIYYMMNNENEKNKENVRIIQDYIIYVYNVFKYLKH